jgi:hypothetical protein
MDILDKLQKYVDHRNLEIIDFEKYVQDKYSSISNKLQKNTIKYIEFKKDDFLELIDEVTNILNGKNIEHLNLLYDHKINKLAIYNDDSWEEYLLTSGVKRIISIIKENYLDSYESYLIFQIDNSSEYKKQQCYELLDEYYRFISCFDIKPTVIGYHDIPKHDLYMSRYKRIFEKITKSEMTNIKKEVLDIIKINSIRNVDEMNKYIMELLNADENFKKKIFE